MAGDWIKMRTDLYLDPKVVRITSALCPENVRHESFKFDVVGRLHFTWTLADQYTTDGFLRGYSSEILDNIVRLPGWTAALKSVDWMEETAEGLIVTRFTKHNGESAKRRAMDRERKKNVRETSAKRPPKKRTKRGPEKRREEKRIQTPTESVPRAASTPRTTTQPKPTRPRDDLFDAVAEVGGADPALNGKLIGKVCQELRATDPPYTPAEVRALPAALAAHGLDFTITVPSIPKHIGRVRITPRAGERHGGKPGGGVGSDSRVRAPAGKYANVPVIRVGATPVASVGGEAGSPGEAPDAEADRTESANNHPGDGER